MGRGRDTPGCPRPSPPDRHLVETQRALAETTRPTAHLGETSEGLAEATGTAMNWSMADPYHRNMADGRIPLQLTLKPRSVKLIHHQELGNATLSSIHLDKRAQQGRPIRII